LRSDDRPDRRGVPQTEVCGLYQLSYSSTIFLNYNRAQLTELRQGDHQDRLGVPPAWAGGIQQILYTREEIEDLEQIYRYKTPQH
jgi:hypothetical protein